MRCLFNCGLDLTCTRVSVFRIHTDRFLFSALRAEPHVAWRPRVHVVSPDTEVREARSVTAKLPFGPRPSGAHGSQRTCGEGCTWGNPQSKPSSRVHAETDDGHKRRERAQRLPHVTRNARALSGSRGGGRETRSSQALARPARVPRSCNGPEDNSSVCTRRTEAQRCWRAEAARTTQPGALVPSTAPATPPQGPGRQGSSVPVAPNPAPRQG